MKLLALIPARGGSKRLPNKNLRKLAGKPLINWSIAVARESKDIADILVSTDSHEIAEIARAEGALVPWLRPAELATDTATSMQVCLHALSWYEKERNVVDGLLLLQPTSPFRTIESVQRAIDLFKQSPQRSVVSFSPAQSHPMWCFRIVDESLVPFVKGRKWQARSQDIEVAYVLNGSIYIASPSYLRLNKGFLGPDTKALIMHDYKEAMDIDTSWDWMMAELLCKENH